MNSHPLRLTRVDYAGLNSRQKENFNYAHVSAILANYGFTTMRLTDDWEGADFIAQHISGEPFLKVQLKSRLWVDTKYKLKDIWMCFREGEAGSWYLYPHDAFLEFSLHELGIGSTAGWENSHDLATVKGAYSWPSLSVKAKQWLSSYAL